MKLQWIQYCLLQAGVKPCRLMFCTASKLQCDPLLSATKVEYVESAAPAVGSNELMPTHISGDSLPPVNELHGYTTPTFIQKYAIPSLLAGRDLMACAQTGSGKTAAFLLPIIDHLLDKELKKTTPLSTGFYDTVSPYSLILEPTRELVRQIFYEALKFVNGTLIKVAMLHGGSENYREQINKLRMTGGNIIVATPGRLNDVINQQIVSMADCRYCFINITEWLS
ncbi:unnamed protein product [Soboliphyme baturini]|uniref:Helicase ATP-binding domain-containing protein n=1 Tax=Soboliphyme baturini TaxID=241478 RepID=A0A183IQG1_9BILA|nr:unnamed protein product [Soboliphyme baturini]